MSPDRSGPALILVAAAVMSLSCADSQRKQPSDAIRPTYDKDTGKLTQLDYDSDKNGQVDTWTAMNGAKPVQSRVDRNEDGRVDRWEHYDETGRLTKVGISRNDTGKADAWAFPGSDNAVHRIEISSSGDEHKIDRWEHYDPSQAGSDGKGGLVRAEEDTNADGKPDKWETYQRGTIETVAFDENQDGVPDRRLFYRGSALVRIESHPDPSGRFTRRTDVK